MDLNPFLKPTAGQSADRTALKGSIEHPDRLENIPWQTRSALPTEYENQLADALEHVFDAGATEVAAIVSGLNARGSRTPAGEAWTAETLQREMQRLAAK